MTQGIFSSLHIKLAAKTCIAKTDALVGLPYFWKGTKKRHIGGGTNTWLELLSLQRHRHSCDITKCWLLELCILVLIYLKFKMDILHFWTIDQSKYNCEGKYRNLLTNLKYSPHNMPSPVVVNLTQLDNRRGINLMTNRLLNWFPSNEVGQTKAWPIPHCNLPCSH